jgi:TnpA family transposase
VTIVTHVSDIWMPFGTQRVISTNDREALYVIDALCHHESDFDIQEHHTDHAGYSLHVFALCALLGIRFAPHLRSLTEQLLYSVAPLQLDPPFAALMKGLVDTDLIVEAWDDILRLAASIRHSKVSASLIMRKLASYPRQNRLEKALKEMGKLERTLFILDYLRDPTLRHRVRLGLNKGESTFSLARALFFGQLGQFHERTFLAQSHRASCLLLLVAAIGTWNTVYLQKAVGALREAGIDVPLHLLSHVSPLAWHHINFYGQYHFDPRQARPLDQLRALRHPLTPDLFSAL